ncbi:glycosyltransferase family 2 protein [Bifidobacterium sp. MA2]|uniref:Glycosyltransferase family 2 protein n=1 Tax=Bifidobacterium santillanense TaxID=2809028 RepID=A0ABS5URB7_9BIFI|nr:glycosyltransferase family 2 protein [Bifidobacterium santillanense]MBT1173514.1 glycosyltransferase family 2 protein [Bifidobacterium santillanense]
MYTVLGNRSYQVSIETVEETVIGSDKRIVVTGWAVDKLRNRALDLSIKARNGHLTRQVRPDVTPVFGLDPRERSGFSITIPAGDHVFIMGCETPGGTIARKVDLNRVRRELHSEFVRKRMRQMSFYLSHAWTKQGAKALYGAVKRRFVKQQSFYERWIANNETMTKDEAASQIAGFQRRPLISIVTPVYNVDEVWLRKFVESVQNQWYDNWELCLADDHSPAKHVKPLLEELAKQDPRIKVTFRSENGRIAKATNSAIELATGDYVGFMDNDDELAPQALFEVVKALNDDPQIDFVYTDEDKINEHGTRFDPFFKPDWSPDLLLGHNYITHFVVVSKPLLDTVGALRSEYDGSQDYDFVLRATEQARKVHHIPQMLYHWRTLASSVAGDPRSKMYAYEAGRAAIEAALQRRGITGNVRMLDNLGTYKIDYTFDLPSVVVIAAGYNKAQFQKLQDSADYPSVRFVRIEDGDEATRAAADADETLAVFLDGMMPQDKQWLREMVNYSHNQGIAVVGGKIFDSRHRVVNVGVTLRALRSGKPFEMRGAWDEGIGYYFRDLLPRDMFAVTEDCMLVTRKEFVDMGGFNSQLKPGLRGIDYCVRVREQSGRAALWQPYSVFTDLKHDHLTIDGADAVKYINSRRNLADPFASVCFPADYSKQEGIKYVLDRVETRNGGTTVLVTGWAADLHGNEEVDITLRETPDATLERLERIVRLDVNLENPVPGDSVLGFKAEIALHGNPKRAAKGLALVFTTPTDHKEAKLNVRTSPVLEGLASFFHKVALLRHPRATGKRLIEKYWSPRWQKQAYQKLIKRTEQYNPADVRRQIDGFSYKPLISLLVPVYNVDPQWLEKCVDSVIGQYYDNWELCLADDCSTDERVRPKLTEIANRDSRIRLVFRDKNGHISRATNSALAIADGEFVGLLDNDDELAPQALFEVVKALNENPETDLIYSDEDKEDEEGNRFDPHFKPNYSPDLLLSTNYISHFGVYRKSIVDEIGGFRVGYEGSQDYDLVLRFVEKTEPSRIRHIAKVLYHWRTLATSTASGAGAKSYASDAGLKALQSAMERRGVDAEVVSAGPNGIYNVHYAIADPELVSVIIPTKNGYDNIERCVTSIIEKTEYKNYEIVIADNGSTNPHMFELYKRYEQQLGDRFRVEEIDIPFNFSRINNLAAQKAKGKYLLFLNDDTEVISPEWMTRMVSFAQLDRVGVVGAKLYYPTETIQHAGIVLGLGGAAGHIQVGFPRTYLGYFGRLIENVNYSAVTAACCMVKAADFHAVNGFDEDLAVAYNDVDLCLRIGRDLGRDIVWAHEVELYHYESVTRGYDIKSQKKKERLEQEADKMRKKYPALIENDPYYNPNLSRTSGNYWVRKV